MAYDLATQWDGVTGHHSGLSSDTKMDITNSLDVWMKGGIFTFLAQFKANRKR